MVQIKCVNIDVFLPQGKTEHKCAEIRHKKGRENNFIPLPQTVDKALLLQGFAIVGTAFLI